MIFISWLASTKEFGDKLLDICVILQLYRKVLLAIHRICKRCLTQKNIKTYFMNNLFCAQGISASSVIKKYCHSYVDISLKFVQSTNPNIIFIVYLFAKYCKFNESTVQREITSVAFSLKPAFINACFSRYCFKNKTPIDGLFSLTCNLL